MTDAYDKRIRFNGDINERDEALTLIDEVIKKKGEDVEIPGLAKGLNHLMKLYNIVITDDDDFFEVMVSKGDASGSEDKISFEINKKNKSILILKSIDDIDESMLDDGDDVDLLSDI